MKEKIAKKKIKVSKQFSGIQEESHTLEIQKRIAESTLDSLKQSIIEKKKIIEAAKGKKTKKQEESKTYLATEKLAFSKKTVIENPSGQTPRIPKKS